MSPEIVFQFENNIQERAAGLLIASGAGTPATVRAGGDDAEFAKDAQGVELPRVGVECLPFSRASGQMCFTTQGVAFYNHYRGQLAIEITTPRVGGRARHYALVGLARRLFNFGAAPDFPPYCLLEIDEGAGSLVLVQEGERDRTRLVFNLQIAIPDRLVDYSTALPLPPIATT